MKPEFKDCYIVHPGQTGWQPNMTGIIWARNGIAGWTGSTTGSKFVFQEDREVKKEVSSFPLRVFMDWLVPLGEVYWENSSAAKEIIRVIDVIKLWDVYECMIYVDDCRREFDTDILINWQLFFNNCTNVWIDGKKYEL